MADNTWTKAYKSWAQALENMRTAITANPLVGDPLMASAQVFEDVGRMIFGTGEEPKKRPRRRTKAKRATAKKRAPARAKNKSARGRRRTRKS